MVVVTTAVVVVTAAVVVVTAAVVVVTAAVVVVTASVVVVVGYAKGILSKLSVSIEPTNPFPGLPTDPSRLPGLPMLPTLRGPPTLAIYMTSVYTDVVVVTGTVVVVTGMVVVVGTGIVVVVV